MSSPFEQARGAFQAGVAHFQAGRWAEAEAGFRASLALAPAMPSTLLNLGATLLKLGRPHESLATLDQALAAQPDNAEALGHRTAALAALDRREEAADCLARMLALDGSSGSAWSMLGSLLKDLDRPAEAASAFRNAIERGGDAELNRYFLAAVTGHGAPDAPPRRYVEMLFDTYAAGFDDHLVGLLNYRAHQVLADGVRGLGRRFAGALDLGCGTGLCGAQLRPLVDRLEGVDLSANMVAQAAARGIYDALAQDDAAHHLAQSAQRFDLVVAADVFIYVGALHPVFAGVARLMDAGGVFCFSVEEAAQGEDLALRGSLRYVHSERSIRALAQEHGFEVSQLARRAIREDQRVPIPGIYAWLVRR
ncbi:MAG: methyltransferase domain-containing protein [Burkholderiales bacterium]|nr:methyltransferase domain-containing protein [Burkholderiales bacterium]